MSDTTTQDRDALREAVGRGIEEAWKYYNVIYEPCDPDDEARQKWVDCITEQVAAVVRRELEAPGDDEALWREYEEAREEFENSAKLYQFAGDSESLSDLARDRARLDAAVRALAAGDGQDSRAWRPVDPNNLPEPQWMLVTNNIDARDARGDMSHLWLVYMLHAPSLNEPQYGVTAFSGNRRICYITHWRPAIPEGADRMIVATTDPQGA